MKALSLFLPRILPHVVGCPEVTAQEALIDTAIEFCERTLVVQKTLNQLDTEKAWNEYTLPTPNDQVVVIPVAVWFKAKLLEPVAAQAIQNVQAYTDNISGSTVTQGTPTSYFWTAPNTLGLYPVPDTDEVETLTVRAALKPKRSATQLEDVLFDDWLDPLVSGTLARLHAMKDQPWASSDRALLRSREFRNGLQRARIESSQGRVRANLSVNLRRGFA